MLNIDFVKFLSYIFINISGISNSKFAYILLSSIDGVAAALVLNGHWLTVKSDDLTKDARHIRVDSLTSKNKRFRNSVFLGNLPFDCNEEDVSNYFIY